MTKKKNIQLTGELNHLGYPKMEIPKQVDVTFNGKKIGTADLFFTGDKIKTNINLDKIDVEVYKKLGFGINASITEHDGNVIKGIVLHSISIIEQK